MCSTCGSGYHSRNKQIKSIFNKMPDHFGLILFIYAAYFGLHYFSILSQCAWRYKRRLLLKDETVKNYFGNRSKKAKHFLKAQQQNNRAIGAWLNSQYRLDQLSLFALQIRHLNTRTEVCRLRKNKRKEKKIIYIYILKQSKKISHTLQEGSIVKGYLLMWTNNE